MSITDWPWQQTRVLPSAAVTRFHRPCDSSRRHNDLGRQSARGQRPWPWDEVRRDRCALPGHGERHPDLPDTSYRTLSASPRGSDSRSCTTPHTINVHRVSIQSDVTELNWTELTRFGFWRTDQLASRTNPLPRSLDDAYVSVVT